MYGVTNELKVCEVDVKGTGVPQHVILKEVTKLFPFDIGSETGINKILNNLTASSV
jgi:hypothetical protein